MKSILIAVACLGISGAACADPHNVYGLWLTEAQDGHIEITNCGDGTPCGALVWADPAKKVTDKDARNKNESLRGRDLIGVPIVWGYSCGRSGWKSGKIYNPEDGKTFQSSVKRRADGTLQVKGCLGPLCITNIWTPITGN